jgi:purine-binding chemotaxis protein CheW
MSDAGARDQQGKVLSFRVGDLRLALPAADVAQVVRSPHLTRVPHAPAALTGVANLGGAVVPVLSLARLMGQQDGAVRAIGRVILLDRSPQLGLAVDEVTAFTAAGQTTEPSVATPGARLFLDEDGSRRLIDLDGLLAREFGVRRRKHSDEAASTQASVAPGVAAACEVGLLGFDLAGQSYALPLEQVHEVMALPPGIVTMPRLDDALVGVVSYRGGLLPLASLRALLGLAPSDPGASGRVVVAQIGEALVGLVVDRLDAVIRAPETAIGAVPTVLNRGGGEAQIDSIFRAADGVRLVSILSPEHLFRDDTIGNILAEGREKEIGPLSESGEGGRERFVVFRLGDESYGLPIGAVDEVVRLPDPLTRVPRAPAFVEGVMNFRGRVIPLIDLRRRFDVDAERSIGWRRVLMTRIGDLQAGFIVDAVSEIADLAEDQLRRTPELPGEGARLFDRVAHLARDGRMVLLVDPEAMLDRVEADLLKAMSGTGGAPASP